jgi:hypothetical protein
MGTFAAPTARQTTARSGTRDGEHDMTGRSAVVIGAVAAGVVALGAQTALAGGDPAPELQLSGPKKQSPWRNAKGHGCVENERCQPHVKVTTSCGDVACTARAKGKLTKVKKDKLEPLRGLASADLAPGEGEPLVLKLTKKQRKQVRKALDDGEKVQAKVTVEAKDAAGNVATATRSIKLVK